MSTPYSPLSWKNLLFVCLFAGWSINANAQVLDVNQQELDFSADPTLILGIDKAAGSKYRYTNVITIAGTQVNAILTIEAIHEAASVNNLDANNYNDGRDKYYAPFIAGGGSSNSRVDFTIAFVDTNDDPLTIANFSVNSIDIDGPEFVEYGGFDSYVLSQATDLITTAGQGNRIRFSGTGNYSGLIINDKGRVETKFGEVQSIQITMGTKNSTAERQFGSVFKTLPFDASTSEVKAPTVAALQTANTTPTITGTLAALSGSESFTVIVNNVTYTNGDGNLSVSGTTWSLTIPIANVLAPGTYDVIAIRNGLIDLPDQTSSELTITAPSNTAPVAVADAYTLNEAETLSAVNVLDNDSDAQSDALTAVQVSGPSNGTLTLNSDGSFTYVHDGSETITDSFVYKANDGNLDSNNVTVTLTITPVNDAPIASDDTYAVGEGLSLTATTVLANDSDAENSALTAIKVSNPSYGLLTFNADGTFVYAHDGSEINTDSFTYRANDGNTDSNTVTVTINITLINDAPIANSDTATVNEDENVVIDILVNDSDADGSIAPTSVSVVTGPSNGALSVNAVNGSVTYTPTANYQGSDSFTYRVDDDSGASSNVATVTITVLPVNDLPTAQGQTLSTNEDTALNIALSGADTDNDTLTFVVKSTPTNGVLSGSGANLVYTPNSNYNGADTFTFVSNDGSGDSATATVTINVLSVNDLPTAQGQSLSTNEDTALNITLSGADTDNDALTFVVKSTPTNGVLSGSGANLVYAPNSNYNGADTFTFVSNDGTGDSATATVNITVSPENDLPEAQSQSLTTNEDTELSILLIGSDTDGDTLTFIIENAPSNGTLSGSQSNIVYRPNADYNGTDTFTFVTNDGKEKSTPATVNITITPVNDDPIDENENVIITDINEVVIIDVLSNSEDPDGDVLNVASAESEDGNVAINDDGTLSFFADEGFSGTTTITYIISDGNGGTYTSIVTITLDAVNLPPVAVDDSFTFEVADVYVLDVLVNDTDPENDSLTITNASSEFGSAEIIDNKVTLTPFSDASGEFVLSYRISDGVNEESTARAFITINLDTGPVITVPDDLCGFRTVNATALYTSVDLGQASAVDRFGNVLPVSLLNSNTLFAPGINEATWSATDSDGNKSVAIQQVCVNPLISIAKDQTVLEGKEVRVGVYLNGASPTYPVEVPFYVGGSADENDHDLIDGILTINAGTEGSINFTTFEDNQNDEGDVITLALSEDFNLGSKNRHSLVITEGNIAPEITLTVTQRGQTRLTVSQDGGNVSVSARVNDPNSEDTFTYFWDTTNDDIFNISTTDIRYLFDPSNLLPGVYTISLEVADSGLGNLTDNASVYIEVVEQLTALGDTDSDGDLIPDNIEGFQDNDGDGIPDYLDRIEECNVLPENVVKQDGYLIEGDPGVCLRRGDFTIGKTTGGAQLTEEDISNNQQDILTEDPDATHIGGIFDFIAYGLAETGGTYALVIPQLKPIPVDPVYRKFRRENGWGFFVEDSNNSMWSTQGEPGYCPPPNTSATQTQWTPGLTQGHWCVQLVVEDGGPNDDDNLINGTIVDPGGVGVLLNGNLPPEASNDVNELYMNSDITLDVLENDNDPDSDILLLTSATASIGTVEIIDNQLQYTAPRNYVGPVSILYGVTDDNGGTDQGVVTLTILLNTAPSIINHSSQIEQGSVAVINLLVGSADPEGDILRLISTDNVNVSYDADGNASFSPAANFYGTLNIQYMVEDAVGNIVSAEWSITVIQVFEAEAKTEGGSTGGLFIIGLVAFIYFRRQGLGE